MNKNKNGKNNKKLLISAMILVAIVIILAGIAVYFVANKSGKDDKTLAYTDLIKEMSYGNIEKIEMTVGSTSIKVKVKDDEKEKISKVPLKFSEVMHVDSINAKPVGNKYIVILKISMNGNITLRYSHDIAGKIKEIILEEFENIYDVVIHINPH